jgi:cytoskeletal protein RodZ
VFEVGSSLREARERGELELSGVERDTRIRVKYLQALEDERFDRLPAPVYARAFLRSYADYLGLDAQRFVDEYDTRFAPAEAPQAAPPVRVQRPGHFRRRALVVLPFVLLAGLVAWGISLGSSRHPQRPTATPAVRHVRLHATTPPRVSHPATPTKARIDLTATRGPCWLSVRVGTAAGQLVWEGTLQQSRRARFSARRLWIRLGAPWNVDASLNGRHVSLPGSIGNVVVAPRGLHAG